MRLVRRDGSALPLAEATLYSAGWGIGVGAGVALGAVLTATSGSGAPGVGGIRVGPDLVGLPLGAGIAVFVVHLAVSIAIALLRGRGAPEGES